MIFFKLLRLIICSGKGNSYMFLNRLVLLAFVCSSFAFAHDVYACSAGQYLDYGDQTCKECLAGRYCVNDEINICPAGSVSDVGASECTVCSGNTYANEMRTECVACTGANEYLDNNECYTCPAGSYINEGSCISCPSGYACDGSGSSVECPDGTYPNSDRTECVTCDGAKEYINNGVCSVCSGDRLANSEHTACDNCDVGYCMNNNTSCKKCHAGDFCPKVDGLPISCNGMGRPSSNDYRCKKGEYSLAGSVACTSCPIGYTTEYDESVSSASCIPAEPFKLSFGENISVSLPDCLTPGKINTKVVKLKTN